jgi:hypothetical protein
MPFSSLTVCDNFANYLRNTNGRVAEYPPIPLSYDRVSADVDYAVGKKKPMFEASYDLSGPAVLSVHPLHAYSGSVGNGIAHAASADARLHRSPGPREQLDVSAKMRRVQRERKIGFLGSGQ